MSATILAKTNIGPGNTILVHPNDSAILSSLDDYKIVGDTTGGDFQRSYQVGTVVGGKYKVLSSPIVPQGKMMIMLTPDNPKASVYLYCPYIPVTVAPWPLGPVPSLSFMSRYAKALVRPQGIAILKITQ